MDERVESGKPKKTPLLSSVQAFAVRLGKYRWAALVLLLGVLLMLLPAGQKAEPAMRVSDALQQEQQLLQQKQQELQELLCRVEGAGEVQVLLSLSASAEHIYQTDRTQSRDDAAEQSASTVVLQQSGSDRTPVVRKTIYPVYQGAVVACTGAGSAGVRLAITEAVSSLTGLGSDKITVIQLKAD